MARDDVALDLEELKQLHSMAKRPRIVSFLSAEIDSLEKMLKSPAPPPTPLPERTPAASGVKTSGNLTRNYATLSSFSWDQDNEKVKIYVSLEGIDREKVEADFKPAAFDVKFHDVEGKNYRCVISKLSKDIVPEKCAVTVKPKRAIITLVKASNGHWMDLHFKEDKLKPSMDKERDPMAGIMDLMKNMYEEGDDEMKRTIAKAWTDARSGKAADTMKGFT